jgi:hypothetical protein
MFPHPNTVADVRTLQNQDLLRNAARERLAKEATRHAPSPSWIEMGSASMCRLLVAMSASAATSLFTRPLARAWR